MWPAGSIPVGWGLLGQLLVHPRPLEPGRSNPRALLVAGNAMRRTSYVEESLESNQVPGKEPLSAVARILRSFQHAEHAWCLAVFPAAGSIYMIAGEINVEGFLIKVF